MDQRFLVHDGVEKTSFLNKVELLKEFYKAEDKGAFISKHPTLFCHDSIPILLLPNNTSNQNFQFNSGDGPGPAFWSGGNEIISSTPFTITFVLTAISFSPLSTLFPAIYLGWCNVPNINYSLTDPTVQQFTGIQIQPTTFGNADWYMYSNGANLGALPINWTSGLTASVPITISLLYKNDGFLYANNQSIDNKWYPVAIPNSLIGPRFICFGAIIGTVLGIPRSFSITLTQRPTYLPLI
jgi:hypothetical protein